MNIDELEYEFSLKPDSSELLNHYVLHVKGQSIYWDDTSSKDLVVAELHSIRVDFVLAYSDGLKNNELLELLSPELADFAKVLLSGDDCMIENKNAEKVYCDGLIYIQSIEVIPSFRGKSIGTEMLKRLPEVLNIENCLIALKAFPIIQDPNKKRKESDIIKVKNFYKQMGFTHIGEDFMVKDANLCEVLKNKRQARLTRS